MHVPESKKLSAEPVEPQNGTPNDIATRDPASGPRVQGAKVLVVTTDTAFKAVDHWHPEIAEHVGASCIFVHEEGQQAPELLSVSAVAMTRSCHVGG